MDANKLSSISRADSLEKTGEFWNTHDFTDYDTDAPDVEFKVTCAVPVEEELLSALEELARRRGVKTETLANLWLYEKLKEQKQPVSP